MRTTPRRFTKEEDRFICANYHAMLHGDIAGELGRGTIQVRKRAAKLGIVESAKRYSESQDKAIRSAYEQGLTAKEASALIGIKYQNLLYRARRLGIKFKRKRSGRHSGRPIDGFKDGKPIYTHRRVVEDHLGRKLKSTEIVHHIDHDKDNNRIENLHVFKSRNDHRSSHCSFESIVPELVERGIINFNSDKGVYELCETNS